MELVHVIQVGKEQDVMYLLIIAKMIVLPMVFVIFFLEIVLVPILTILLIVHWLNVLIIVLAMDTVIKLLEYVFAIYIIMDPLVT